MKKYCRKRIKEEEKIRETETICSRKMVFSFLGEAHRTKDNLEQ